MSRGREVYEESGKEGGQRKGRKFFASEREKKQNKMKKRKCGRRGPFSAPSVYYNADRDTQEMMSEVDHGPVQ